MIKMKGLRSYGGSVWEKKIIICSKFERENYIPNYFLLSVKHDFTFHSKMKAPPPNYFLGKSGSLPHLEHICFSLNIISFPALLERGWHMLVLVSNASQRVEPLLPAFTHGATVSLLRVSTHSMGKVDCSQKCLNNLVILDGSTNTKGQYRQMVIKTHWMGTRKIAHSVKHLPSKEKDLSSIPSTHAKSP